MSNRITSSRLKVQQRRTTVARLYLQQRTQGEIACEVGVDQGTVSRDLKAIQAEWQRERLDDFQQGKFRELARIDQLEREYWQAWKRSCQDREQTVQEKTTAPRGDRLKAGTRTEGRDGNPEFLRGVERCVEMRCKILNLFVMQVNATGTLRVAHDLSRLSDDELHQLEKILGQLAGPEERPARTLPPGPGSADAAGRAAAGPVAGEPAPVGIVADAAPLFPPGG
jgi:DNA-binding MarR family transcriptional regulator